ncbi:hypothetical protein D3C72_2086990 [compost metagenome]
MPGAYASTGLPGLWFNSIALTPFDIPYQAFPLLFVQNFAIDHHIDLTLIGMHALIVKIGRDLQSNITYWIKW